LILVLKNGIEYITNFTGAGNVGKLYSVIEELSTL
jgi:exopolysaccharide biosynthesis predicted pyruvyltransferase EpsI